MPARDDLQDFGRRVDGLLAEADRKRADPSLVQNLRAARQKAEDLAAELDKPVRVGVVGNFSSGKTQLIEALLGAAGMLATGPLATTSNIVEFTLDRAAAGPTGGGSTAGGSTGFGAHRVRFFDKFRADDLLRGMLRRAVDLVGREPSLEAGLHRRATGWLGSDALPHADLKLWARDVHAGSAGDELKPVTSEVYRLAHSVVVGWEWLGKTVELPRDRALELMKLDADPASRYERELSEWDLKFPPLGRGEPDATAWGEADLRALAPLIAKIQIDVTLSAAAAGDLEGVEMQIVDCPGANAEGSAARDEELCALELQDCDAVLALLSGESPSQKTTFIDPLLLRWGPAAKARLIAVVSRFDELPHDASTHVGQLEALAGEAGPLSDEELLDGLPPVRTAFASSRKLVESKDPGRTAWVSAFTFLSERLTVDGGFARGSDEFYRDHLKVDPSLPAGEIEGRVMELPWVREAHRWHAVAERLGQGADSQIAPLLAAFAEDGGFGRLLRTVREQVETRSGDHRRVKLEEQFDLLARRVDRAARAVEKLPEPAPPEEEADEGGDAAAERVEALARLRDALDQLEQDLRADAVGRPLTADPDGDRPVEPLLQKALVRDVFGWREWRALMNRVGGGSAGGDWTVRPVPAAADHPDRGDGNVPVCSHDFLAPFCRTLAGARAALAAAEEESWVLHSGDLVAQLARRLGGREEADRVRGALGPDGDRFWPATARPDPVDGDAGDGDDPPIADDPAALRDHPLASHFPLPLDRPFYYAWHGPLLETGRGRFADRHRHLMYVVRLRQALVDAAHEWLANAVFERERALAETARGHVRAIRDAVAAALRQAEEEAGPAAVQPLTLPGTGTSLDV